jgi:beta-phosphoglucomutase
MAWKEAFREAGIEVDAEDILLMEGANDRGIVDRVIADKRSILRKDILFSVPARKHVLFNMENVKSFDGMETCLRELHENFSLALVSGSDRNAVEKMTDMFFPGIFDTIVSGSDVILGKPHPDPYLKAVRMLSVPKDECMVIENAPRGIEAAKRAGLFCIGIPTYVERINFIIRTCLARFIRKGVNFSKTMIMHQKALDFFQAWYNFIKPHNSLKLKVDSHNRKWLQRTPAMAENITDHIWSLKELLTFRVPIQ